MANITPSKPDPRWFALVNDRIFTMPRQRVTGSLIKNQASIPRDNSLFRDHGTSDDVFIDDEESVDLANGNVFLYRENCGSPTKGKCPAPPKMALCLDDRFELTAIPTLTGADILELFGLPKDTKLFRDYESPDEKIVKIGDNIHFKDGPCFLSKSGSHGPKEVSIKINGVDKAITRGEHPVAALKKLGHVDASDELVLVIDNKPQRLPSDDSISICGGEVFISHPCRGTSA